MKSTCPGVSIRLIDHIVPRELHAGRVDRDAALGLFGVVVGRRGALVDFARAVLRAAGEEHPLGDGGLARIDVGNDADVADAIEWSRHGNYPRMKNAAALVGRGVLLFVLTTRSGRRPCSRPPCGGRSRGG